MGSHQLNLIQEPPASAIMKSILCCKPIFNNLTNVNHLQEPRDSKMFRLTQSDKYKGENQLVGKIADLTTRGWKPFYYTKIVEDGNYNLDKKVAEPVKIITLQDILRNRTRIFKNTGRIVRTMFQVRD